jgi:hypothetical protein
VILRLAVLGAFAALALPAASTATTEPVALVNVKISLSAHGVRFSDTHVPRGNYTQFHVRNTTAARRVFTLAGRSIVVPARRVRLLVLFFDTRGRYGYASRAGGSVIRGTFRVS